MKKTYINPVVEVIKIETLQMLALSGGDQPDPGIGAHEDTFDFGDDVDISIFEEPSTFYSKD